MDEFATYERELDLQFRKIRELLVDLRTSINMREVESKVNKLFDDARETLGFMSDIARKKGGNYDARFRNAQAERNRLEQQYKAASQTGTRKELFGGGDVEAWGAQIDKSEYDQRNRLLDGHDKLQRQEQRLREARSLADNAENMGADTLQSMKGQHEQLQNTKNRLDDVNSDVKRARKILASMGRRIVTNKLILIFIIIVLLGATGFVIYWRWVHIAKSSSPSPAPTAPIAPTVAPTVAPTIAPTAPPT